MTTPANWPEEAKRLRRVLEPIENGFDVWLRQRAHLCCDPDCVDCGPPGYLCSACQPYCQCRDGQR